MTIEARDIAVILKQMTTNLCTTSDRALPGDYRKTQSNEVSLYLDTLSDMGVAKNMRRLQSAFPKQSKEFFNVLAERLIANGFTDQRLTDAVNNAIDSFQYKELNISDIVRFDKKMRLYNYKEACKLVTEEGYEFGKDLQRTNVEDRVFWTIKNR